MAESIASRVGRLVSGSLNSIVDAVETMAPEVVMEEAIREVDRAIADVRAELGKVLSSRHLGSRRLADESRRHEDLSEKVRLALTEGREDLAEAAVAQMMDIEAQIPVLEETVNQARESEAELERYIAALQARKREMSDDLKQYRAVKSSEASGEGNGDTATSGDAIGAAVERAETAFGRVMENTTSVAGTMGPRDRKTASQLAELDELARQNRIKERLAAFKNDVEGA
ncbi:MAG TPA: PspA/IM30 family protein [Kiloniellaceae bacterium]|nr:PspA/IM30 family protein [Kiloniellaceae bacterium]